ncbi:hypothetical protein FJR45_02055 [Sulfurimonas sediminis]|uniref:Polymerase nucleotidyl transferase domain-containing protein n=1 Tax=Sulfurimonas sediminis TaxID=2590020 RepID=A0A7M1AZ65_9BACT|nr:nucleotidyltransferase domain-containing protein [Sulfurimonas sediminis]QOP42797.1 hypothetical protein FJR45_02055 [Sulfurimonas sediminis]
MTKEYILDFLKNNKQLLKEKYNVTKIGLFGSYARDEANEGSDIDLIIETSKKDFFLKSDLKDFLENTFDSKIDIGYLDSIREFYKRRIEKEILYV